MTPEYTLCYVVLPVAITLLQHSNMQRQYNNDCRLLTELQSMRLVDQKYTKQLFSCSQT